MFRYDYKTHSLGWVFYRNVIFLCDVGPIKKGRKFYEIERKDEIFIAREYDFTYEEVFRHAFTMREYGAAKIIQRRWRTCISDPSFEVCKKRLYREYLENKISIQ